MCHSLNNSGDRIYGKIMVMMLTNEPEISLVVLGAATGHTQKAAM